MKLLQAVTVASVCGKLTCCSRNEHILKAVRERESGAGILKSCTSVANFALKINLN